MPGFQATCSPRYCSSSKRSWLWREVGSTDWKPFCLVNRALKTVMHLLHFVHSIGCCLLSVWNFAPKTKSFIVYFRYVNQKRRSGYNLRYLGVMVKGWERKYCPLEHGYWSISIDDCECEDRGVFQIGSTRHEWFFSSLDNSFPFPVRRDSSQTSRRQTWHLNPWKSCIIRIENAQWHKIRIWSSSSLPGFIFD